MSAKVNGPTGRTTHRSEAHKRKTGWLLFLGLLLVACGPGESERTTTVSAGADHSQHQAASLDTGGGREAGQRAVVQLTNEQAQALGVTFTAAVRETLTRTIRTVGRIGAAEPSIADVTPKVAGFVERLYVDATGETVRRGQPLLTLYSPDLVAAQEELLTAKRLVAQVDPAAGEAAHSAQALLEAARRRLAYWDITASQIEQLEESGSVKRTLSLAAPVNGIVLEKDVLEGMRIEPGMRLYRLADLSTVWVEGELFEQDIQFVAEGSQAHIEVAAYPGEHLMGTVSFVYPTVDIQSRTNRVRLTVPNSELRLKPGMFATLFFDVTVAEEDIAVPVDAVVVTGERNLVFVRENGLLAPREVVLGARGEDRVQILQGLEEGEIIVASANFLIAAIEPEEPGATPPPGAAADTTDEQGRMREHDHD
jgi:Cu(I)/Ag(I) efflux system membrane fusion protein